MEKAWAKVHGTYERIEAGQCSMAMRDLTGAPSFSMRTDKESNEKDYIDIESELLVWDKMNYIMAASCTVDNATEEAALDSIGLVTGHAYSLIAVHRVEHPHSGETITLVQLRNPWG